MINEELNNIEEILPREISDTKRLIKTRYVLALFGFLGIANVYMMRVNLSVAIVAMVNNSAVQPKYNNKSIDICPLTNDTPSNLATLDGPFQWDEVTQGIILGSFFYGYVITQIPGGRLAELYSAKIVFGTGVVLTALLTGFSPLAAYLGKEIFIFVRIIMGLAEGVTYPAMHVLLSKWAPETERNKFAAYIYSGSSFGTIISMPLTGYLCSKNLWPYAFYLSGFLGVIWFTFWLFMIYDDPSTHPYISQEEKLYIISSTSFPQSPITKVPWKKILLSYPVWAILITQIGQAWAFYTLLTELPSYMQSVLHFDIQQNGIYSTLPYLANWLAGFGFSWIADMLVENNYLSNLNSYKIFNSIGTILPSLGLIIINALGCNGSGIITILSLSGAFGAASLAGYQMNHLNLCPEFAGTLLGITNGISNLCGFLAPNITGVIIEGHNTLKGWQSVFYLSAIINIIGNIFYVLFASASNQNWANREFLTNEINADSDQDS